MKKTQKKLLGLFGLGVVVATTAFAASLPYPDASAATSTVTDIVSVRVVGRAPDVRVTGITGDDVYVTADHNITVDFEVVDRLTVTLKYTDKDGNVTEYVLSDGNYDYQPGSLPINLNLDDYGFGEFVLTVHGDAVDGIYDEEIIPFKYIPVKGTVSEDPETGNTILNLEYDPDDGTGGGQVDTITVNVYDKDGNLVEVLSDITVNQPDTQVVLPFDENDLDSGEYTIEIIAHNKDGDDLYKPLYISVTYNGEEVIPNSGALTPDTGGIFGGLNISKSDYLITGLIIFGIAGIGGAVFILKRDKKAYRRH